MSDNKWRTLEFGLVVVAYVCSSLVLDQLSAGPTESMSWVILGIALFLVGTLLTIVFNWLWNILVDLAAVIGWTLEKIEWKKWAIPFMWEELLITNFLWVTLNLLAASPSILFWKRLFWFFGAQLSITAFVIIPKIKGQIK